MNRILVTGGCGFIGSNFIRLELESYANLELWNLDCLSYAGNPENLEDLSENPRYRFIHGDITDRALVDSLLADAVDAVVNFAAESHVDRSIHDSEPFVQTNIVGTSVLLDAAQAAGLGRFLQISSDEVYGSLGATGLFSESTPLAPNSPYSASKAAADLLVRSYVQTFGLPAVITRCSNNYGPYQFPEKLIPLFISNAIQEQPLPLYGDGLQVRDWIHVRDHCSALDLVLRSGRVGEVYNIGAGCEKPNIEITRSILRLLGKPESLIRHVADRLGHDRRYAIDSSKIQHELDWKPEISFEQGVAETIQWYQDHAEWVAHVRSGAYRDYYQKQYKTELG